MSPTIGVAFISPNGSTRMTAGAIIDELTASGATAVVADISRPSETRSLIRALATDNESLLFIGSPVYANSAVPPVMSLIDELPHRPRCWAAPFATYGIACSGIALWQMAAALGERGYQLAGAAKIAALHSVMWRSDNPVGQGRPNSDDLGHARRLAGRLLARLKAGTLAPLALAELDYQPPHLAEGFKAGLAQPWSGIERTVDRDLCDECGECVQSCPVDAITLDPTPAFGDACFHCLNCIRRCPNNAITPAIPLAALDEMIRKRVETINEQPRSQLFVAEPVNASLG